MEAFSLAKIARVATLTPNWIIITTHRQRVTAAGSSSKHSCLHWPETPQTQNASVQSADYSGILQQLLQQPESSCFQASVPLALFSPSIGTIQEAHWQLRHCPGLISAWLASTLSLSREKLTQAIAQGSFGGESGGITLSHINQNHPPVYITWESYHNSRAAVAAIEAAEY